MKKISTEEFIKRAKKIHGDKYDYSKTEYINRRTKVCIICTKHGEFWQGPYEHITGQNCPKCSKEYVDSLQKKKAQNASIFFERKAKLIHGNKYDYSKVHYINALSKVELVCPNHGSFYMRPNDHLNGNGCPKCGIEHVVSTKKDNTEKWIKKAKKQAW
jgi:predicted  nucleic acid-binding Zn-ribbon protein